MLPSDRGSRTQSSTDFSTYTDADLLDSYIAMTRRAELLKDDSDVDHAQYQADIKAMQDEYIRRGGTLETLQSDADARTSVIMSSDPKDLNGREVNIQFLCDYNNIKNAENVAKYLDLTPFERETTVRFKSELTSETIIIDENGHRLDQSSADSHGPFVLNSGTEYQTTITDNKDGTYHCESEYLGSFDYDPNVFAIGYKEVEGEDTLKLPVLRCLPDACTSGEMTWTDTSHYGMGLEAFDTDIMEKTRMRPEGADMRLAFQEVAIPEGVKNIDYTFENIDNLNFIPRLPDSLESAHCAFKDCDKLWQESDTALDNPVVDFGDHRKMHWPEGLQDMSSMFSGCSQMHDLKFCDFPKEVRTIDNMFDNCSTLFEGVDVKGPLSLLPWAGKTDGILQGTCLSTANEINWSDSPYLLEEFSYCINSETSNTFKKVAEREEEERVVFQAEYSKPENLEKQPEEVQEAYDDAKAANAVVRTEKVLDADVTVRDVEDLSINNPEGNELLALLQRGVIDVGSFAVLKGVTSSLTGSKLAGWAAGLGGTFFLRSAGVLPESFEPILKFAKNILPESTHGVIDTLIDKLHVPTKEDYEAAEAERFARYTPIALEDSMGRSVKSAGVVTTDSLREAMRVNGEVIGSNGTILRVGQEGMQEAACVNNLVTGSVVAAEDVFDQKIAAGEDCNQMMHDYYMQLFEGLDGYNSGVKSGIVSAYGKDQASANEAMHGLGYVNRQYCEAVMKSLKEYDDKYHFMTDEDYIMLDSYGFEGVETLSDYTPGSLLQMQAEQPVQYVPAEQVATLPEATNQGAQPTTQAKTEPTAEVVGLDAEVQQQEQVRASRVSLAQDVEDRVGGSRRSDELGYAISV